MWTLEQKIDHDHAVATVESYIARTGKTPYVSFSGGKDSTVLLDLVRRFVGKEVKGVFCNTGNEFPEIVRFARSTPNVTVIHPKQTVKAVLATYGFPLISKEQAHGIRQARTTKSDKLRKIRLYGNRNKGYISGKISDKWQFLINAPFMVSEQCCECLKKRPFKQYQKETGEVPIIGTLATESEARKQQYVRRGGCNSFREGHLGSYPLSIWTTRIYGHTYGSLTYTIANCITRERLEPDACFSDLAHIWKSLLLHDLPCFTTCTRKHTKYS